MEMLLLKNSLLTDHDKKKRDNCFFCDNFSLLFMGRIRSGDFFQDTWGGS